MGSFRWREDPAHDDADAADDRLIANQVNGAPAGHEWGPRPQNAIQPYGDPTAGWRNSVAQSQQVADAQRRRAARAEARLSQLRADVGWIVLAASLAAFGLGFALAWAIIRRGGGL